MALVHYKFISIANFFAESIAVQIIFFHYVFSVKYVLHFKDIL